MSLKKKNITKEMYRTMYVSSVDSLRDGVAKAHFQDSYHSQLFHALPRPGWTKN